jgi:cbb3-type cytochrome oxidase subunit 3
MDTHKILLNDFLGYLYFAHGPENNNNNNNNKHVYFKERFWGSEMDG